MNTRQLVAIWYAGVVVCALLFWYANERVPLSPIPLLPGAVILGGSAVVTLAEHPRASRPAVLRWGVLPACAALTLFGFLIVTTGHDRSQVRAAEPTSIPVDSIKVSDLSLDGSWKELRGRVTNSSPLFVSDLYFKITMLNKDGHPIDTGDAHASVWPRAGPGETRSFDAYVSDMRPMPGCTWSWILERAAGWNTSR